ncbi:MAG: hypothetical protein KDE47_16470, partial [Caldilineaceae bacterium]|nr:hypothetical protein [Caldilineaceae bacterium]
MSDKPGHTGYNNQNSNGDEHDVAQTNILGDIAVDGDFIGRDKRIRGDEIAGDKVEGDKFTVEDINQSTVAMGRGAIATSVKNFFWEIPKPLVFAGLGCGGILIIAIIFIASNLVDIRGAVTAPIPTSTVTPLPFAPASENETLILIATFHSTFGDAEPHIKIRRMIEQKMAELDIEGLQVEVEPTVLTADERTKAEELGNRYKASMIIWGEDTGVEVIVNYLNLREPNFPISEIQITELERAQLANPSAYARFITQDLPSQITFLSLFAIGHSSYLNGEYESAITVIEKAIDSLMAKENQLEGLSDAYFLLGWLYQIQQTKYQQAIANYEHVLQLSPNEATTL